MCQSNNLSMARAASALAGLEVEVLERVGVDGLEQQDKAAEDEHAVANEVMLVAVLHLHASSSHTLTHALLKLLPNSVQPCNLQQPVAKDSGTGMSCT